MTNDIAIPDETNVLFAKAVRAMPSGYVLIHTAFGWRCCRIERIFTERQCVLWDTPDFAVVNREP